MLANTEIAIKLDDINLFISRYSCDDIRKVEMTNNSGGVVFKQLYSQKLVQIPIQDFKETIYFIRIIFFDGTSVMKKVQTS